tara:strand:- start:27 stop:836 length:810 start_codon:yes stop_codon:yes gene_type:complete
MATIQYITGFNVKPKSISGIGVVTFTDGTNNLTPNQLQCEAYGYTYDKDTGTCTTFRFSTNLNRNISNTNNTIRGSQNTTETGTNNTLIMGERNTVKGLSRNNLIVGSNNEIANGVNNATVLGSEGIAIREGEFVVGSPAGMTSIFTLSGITTDATATALFVNGDPAVTTIPREDDTVYYYTLNIFAFREGGSSGVGAIGDRLFIQIHGMVLLTTLTESATNLVTFGTTSGWVAACTVTGGAMLLKVTGVADTDIIWEVKAEFSKLVGR